MIKAGKKAPENRYYAYQEFRRRVYQAMQEIRLHHEAVASAREWHRLREAEINERYER